MPDLEPDFYRFAESFLADSTVLIMDGERPVLTGFFVSEDGDVCTCHHAWANPANRSLSALWGRDRLPLHYVAQSSAPAEDFALFRADLSNARRTRTVPLPLFQGELSNSRDKFDLAVTAGFAGIGNRDAPPALRLFDGRLEGLSWYQNPAAPGIPITQIETLDLTIAGGNSGAPILDLRLFRVVGYVRGWVAESVSAAAGECGPGVREIKPDRLGRACDLSQLSRLRPDLLPQWVAAGRRADARKHQYFLDTGVPMPRRLLNPEDLRTAAARTSEAAIGRLSSAGVYDQDLCVARPVDEKFAAFLKDSGSTATILTGQSGSGKTNLMVRWTREQITDGGFVLFLTCATHPGDALMQSMPSMLGTDLSVKALLHMALSGARKSVLLLFDGFNESAGASAAVLRNLLRQVFDVMPRDGRFKVVISARTEFLAERIPELFEDQDDLASPFPVPPKFLFRCEDFDEAGKKRVRPFIEVPLFRSRDNGPPSEQEIMYEHFRRQGTMRHGSGRNRGIRPATEYKDLPASIRRFLDRPLLLRFFMMSYDRQEVPDCAVRSRLLDQIIDREIAQVAEERSTRELAKGFLRKLAAYLFLQHRSGASASDSAMAGYPLGMLDALLSQTFLLSRLPGHRESNDLFGFSSDWLFEYFLGKYAWDEYKAHPSGGDALLRELLVNAFTDGEADSHLPRALSYFGARAFEEGGTALGALLRAVSSPGHTAAADTVLAALLEYIRKQHGFASPAIGRKETEGSSFAEVLGSHRDSLGPNGVRSILRYLKKINDEALGDGLALLDRNNTLWRDLQPADRAEWISLLAWSHYRVHQNREAMYELEGIELLEASEETRARCNFVKGRCLQFVHDYEGAQRSFEAGGEDPRFGSQCRHQIAFIRYFAFSDYEGAASMLRREQRPDGTWSNSASGLLYAECLKDAGRYDAAEAVFLREINRRHEEGHAVAEGKACCALADLRLRQFETRASLAAIESALRLTRGTLRYLIYGRVLDQQAVIHGLLSGERDLALECANEALQLARKSPQHEFGSGWALQTRALLFAIRAEPEAAERDLAEAAMLKGNPNQQRRADFIHLLTRWLAPGNLPNVEEAEIFSLRERYRTARAGWYPGLLSLLAAVVGRRPVLTGSEAAAHFGEQVCGDGILSSSFWTAISRRIG